MRQRAIFKLVHAAARQSAVEAVRRAPDGFVVRIEEPNRTLDQNAAQWPILQAFAQQSRWPVNGEICQITDEDWKDILTATFRGDAVRVAPTLDYRRMVMLGLRTSQFGKSVFSDWLEFLHAAAAERDVVVYERDAA